MFRPHHHNPPRPWAPLTDDEWGALWPYVARRAPHGRQVGDLRSRMDAIFELSLRGYHTPWRDIRPEYGRPDTVSRFFRRLTHRGLWHHLLEALGGGDMHPGHPLYRIEHFIVRACRKAARLGGLRLIFLIRRVGLNSALNAPSWLLPDEQLSELAIRAGKRLPEASRRRPGERPRAHRARFRHYLWCLKALHRMAGGRMRLPRAMRLVWP